jgi:hypothetical protein
VAGFPLADLWHATFGQDVTLWSPTPIQMIGGASLTTLASWVLLKEGRRRSGGTRGTRGTGSIVGRLMRPSSITMAGAFLVGLSTLQDEFDMGVPQFNAIYHPILIALAAGIGLVAARVKIGPGGALKAAVVFLVLRGLWAVGIAGVFGLSLPHMPLYLAEAVVVEGAALVVDPSRKIRFGAVAGALIGTVGVGFEWAYRQVAFVLPWQGVLFPEAYLLALVAAVAGFNVTSWQGSRQLVGGTGLQITLLDRVSPGVYRTQHPVPLSGDYKSVLRLATWTTQQAIPVFLPEDKGIPAAGIPAAPTLTRAFRPDQDLLQREAIGRSRTLKRVAYGVLGVLALLWIATLSLGLRRLDRSAVSPLAPLTLRRPGLEGALA